MTDFSDFFTQLFYGTGTWFGLMIFVSILLIIATLHKYAGVLSFAMGLMMSFSYLNNYDGWQALITIIASLFCAMIPFIKDR